ncbi:MAG TPA: MmgE/PrpD family protein [Limnochordales bacterium]
MQETRREIARRLQELAAWAAGLELSAIPEAVRRRAVLVLADDLAAMVSSRDEPEVARVHAQLLRRGGPPMATIFRGGDARTDPFSAAVGNALAANWSELDEGYRKATCHAGLYTLPALLAEAEAAGRPWDEVLRALVIGYEVATRLARAWRFPALKLHPHAIFGAVGAAAAVAALRRHDADRFLNALTGAATLVAVGPYNHAVRGALVRNGWAAAGAVCGMLMADWAEAGIGGLPDTPYDVYTEALGGDAAPELLVHDLGQEWAVANGYHKLYACCQYAHSAVEAALAITADPCWPGRVDAVERVVVETHRLGLTLDNFEPQTTLAARFSMPHIVATALVLKDAGPRAFSAQTLHHPEIRELRRRLELRPFTPELPWPHDRPARVTVRLRGGQELSRECLSAKGGPDRPLSEQELLDKVATLTADVYPRLAETAVDLLELRPDRLAEPWDAIVRRMTGRA